MTPFLMENPEECELGDYIFVPNVRAHVLANDASFDAYAVKPDGTVTKLFDSDGVPVSWDTWLLYPKTKRLSEGVERFVAFMEREQKK